MMFYLGIDCGIVEVRNDSLTSLAVVKRRCYYKWVVGSHTPNSTKAALVAFVFCDNYDNKQLLLSGNITLQSLFF